MFYSVFLKTVFLINSDKKIQQLIFNPDVFTSQIFNPKMDHLTIAVNSFLPSCKTYNFQTDWM